MSSHLQLIRVQLHHEEETLVSDLRVINVPALKSGIEDDVFHVKEPVKEQSEEWSSRCFITI